MKISNKYFHSLSKIFAPIVLDDLVRDGKSSYLSEICLNGGLIDQIHLSMTLGHFLDWLYKILFNNYRNEYIYKNTIANKI